MNKNTGPIWLIIISLFVLGMLIVWQQFLVKEPAEDETNKLSASPQPVRAVGEDEHYLGNQEARATLIVYTDLYCQFCADYHETLLELKNHYSDDLLIVWRHFPLRSDRQSMRYAETAECAGEQGQFWPAVEHIFDNYQENAKLDITTELSQVLDLDQVALNECINSHKYRTLIEAQVAEAKASGILGAPTSHLNGVILNGAYQLDDFSDPSGQEYQGLRSLIDEILAE